MSAATALPLVDAVPLGYALVGELARDAGIRALAIKGPVPAHHGLREDRQSVDVDVLVEPLEFRPLLEAIEALGWEQKTYGGAPPLFEPHSVTLVHPQWPSEIDLHNRFPGFLAPATDVFEALWRERTTITLAGRELAATGLLGSVLILGLHSLRAPHVHRHASELAVLVERVRARRIDSAALVMLTIETGSTHTLEPLLDAIDAAAPEVPVVDQAALATWELRRDQGDAFGVAWIEHLRRTALWRWPVLVVPMLLGDEGRLRVRFPHAPAGRRGLWLARWWRLRAAVRDLPKAVRLARRHRAIG